MGLVWCVVVVVWCVVVSGAAVDELEVASQDTSFKRTGSFLLRKIAQDLTHTTRQDINANYDDGFTSRVNDGTGVFRPIRPGSNVPAANEFPSREDDGEDMNPSPENDDGNIANAETSPEAENRSGNVCFPGSALVQLADGSKKVMRDLRVGDHVLASNGKFSPVFMFTHRIANSQYTFVGLSTASGHRITLTEGHYLYANDRLIAAASISVGDILTLADGSSSPVVQIEQVVDTGLYNPQTVDGDIVVDGIRASTYTTSVDVCVAHALLAPLRAAYNQLGLSLSCFDSGADRLASWVPSGSSIF